MCLLLTDTVVWNYIAKPGCLDGFLGSLDVQAVIVPRVVDQLKDALRSWPELQSVLDAIDAGGILCTELTDEEQAQQIDLINQRPGFGDVDCAQLAIAQARGWTLLTCDGSLKRMARRMKVQLAELSDLVCVAVKMNCLTDADRQWIEYYSQGGTERRPNI